MWKKGLKLSSVHNISFGFEKKKYRAIPLIATRRL